LEATLGPSSYACASCAEVGPSRAKLLRLYEKLRFYTLFRAVPNATAESLNAKIQMIKFRARGYRNEGRFEAAILFHCGGLDLYPTHSKS
jgi:hypothetical protein